jgi:mono/diheme cytochrome c family protein
MNKGHLTIMIALLVTSLVLVGCEREKAPKTAREAMHLPQPGYVADAKRGQRLFQVKCAACHGLDGRGTEKGPPLVNPIYRPGHHDDLSVHLAIKNGTRQHHWNFGNMDPVEDVTPENAADIISYVRKEQRAAGVN